jgi:hypothetical protein
MNGGAGEMLLHTATVFSGYSRGGPEVTREFDTILPPPPPAPAYYTHTHRSPKNKRLLLFNKKEMKHVKHLISYMPVRNHLAAICAPAFAGVTYALSAFFDYGSQPRSNQVISLASLFHLHILLVIIYLGSGEGGGGRN